MLAPVSKFFVPDPVRGGLDRGVTQARPSASGAARMLRGKRSFWLLAIGSGAVQKPAAAVSIDRIALPSASHRRGVGSGGT